MKTRFVMLAFVTILFTSCAPIAPPPIKTAAPLVLTVTVEAAQWVKYQTELARVLLAWYSPKYGFPSGLYKSAICEWDILGRDPQLVYVWAYCSVPSEGIERDVPAIIYLNDNGYPQKAEAPKLDSYWLDDASKMFPADVQAKFDTYTSGSLSSGRLKELVAHARYRYTHPEEPPLIILDTTPAP